MAKRRRKDAENFEVERKSGITVGDVRKVLSQEGLPDSAVVIVGIADDDFNASGGIFEQAKAITGETGSDGYIQLTEWVDIDSARNPGRRIASKSRISSITRAYVRTFEDTGQQIAFVEYIDQRGKRCRTEGDPSSTHMKALLARAEREGVTISRDRQHNVREHNTHDPQRSLVKFARHVKAAEDALYLAGVALEGRKFGESFKRLLESAKHIGNAQVEIGYTQGAYQTRDRQRLETLLEAMKTWPKTYNDLYKSDLAPSERNPPYKPPASGTLPPKGKRMLEAVYVSARERGFDQEAAARQAWCEVGRYYKKSGTKWSRRAKPVPQSEYPPRCGPPRGGKRKKRN